MSLFGKKTVKATLEGDGEYSMNVVGESHYQNNLQRICGHRKEDGEELEIQASLVLEDDNPHDNQAVRIDIKGLTVGYLSRQDAREVRAALKKAVTRGMKLGEVTCDALIVGGWDHDEGDRGFYGVKLDICDV